MSAQSSSWAKTHAALRAELLDRIVETLRADERFVAAWLIGSFGRGEEDAYSDLDLVAVVNAPFVEMLCARPWRGAGRTTPERLKLIEQFGTPVVVHEAHVNAPEGGSHTNVLYETSARLDLNLVPFDRTRRPAASRLLFENVAIPVEPPPEAETLEQRRAMAEQQVALFWIMAEGAAKYRLRGWDVAVQAMLTALREHVERVRRLTAGDPPRFRRYAPAMTLAATPEAQADAVRALCDEMETLLPAVRQLGGEVPSGARVQVEQWLSAR
jgi:hypothetical protein